MIILTITGRVGRDAEIKDVNGKQVISFNVASNQGKDKPPIWFKCDYWRQGRVGEFIKKGTELLVSGEMEEHEKEGKKYQSCKVSSLDFIGSKKEQQASQTTPEQDGAEEQTDDLPF